MRTAIVYSSKTGHTEKYAKWLAEDLGCEAVPYRERKSVDLTALDALVFCSWFHAASIVNAKWAKKIMREHPDLHVVVLATGATPMPEDGWTTEEEIKEAFRHTFPESGYPTLPRFYCHGGFDFDKLDTPNKIVMRMFFKMHEKNARDPKTDEMLKVMREGFDDTKREYLRPVLAHLEGISEKKAAC